MSIRITNSMMYDSMLGNMQGSLANYMKSVEQGSTQKKVNRPSDDPAGMYRILTTRNDLSKTAQLQENVDTATGWLNLEDSVLSTQVPTIITRLKTLAEQAATGTYTAENRSQIAYEAREYFGSLLNLSNTEFEGKSIFAGHKYGSNAYEEGLAMTSWDERWAAEIGSGSYTITGASSSTIAFQFLNDGTLADGANLNYRWTDDGGETWHSGTTTGRTLDFNGVSITMKNDVKVTAADTTQEGVGAENGTTVYIRPTAVYKGDDNDPSYVSVAGAQGRMTASTDSSFDKNYQIRIGTMLDGTSVNLNTSGTFNWAYREAGTDDWNWSTASTNSGTATLTLPDGEISISGKEDIPEGAQVLIQRVATSVMTEPELSSGNLSAFASGSFSQKLLVRLDGVPSASDPGTFTPVNLLAAPPQQFTWSYSTDGGANWVEAKATTTGQSPIRLPVPGGYLDVDKGSDIAAGTQVLIQPRRADLDYEIMNGTYISVNEVGKDIFGGYYEGRPAIDGNDNLFEVVGAFIGYLENNNQEGCQRTLVALTAAEERILTAATAVGGKENRLSVASDMLSSQKLDQQERLSYVEDIDLTELVTNLTKQQTVYQTVLQSSSSIMKMSLANYI